MNLALTATRPIIVNYFNGVLEGLVGSLGIKIHEDEDHPHSTQEGLERCLAEELQQMSVSAPSLEGCRIQSGICRPQEGALGAGSLIHGSSRPLGCN